MSQKNVEVVRSIYERWEAGDFESVDWADLAIEYVVADGPGMDAGTGLAQMAEIQRDFLSAWEEWRVKADEYRTLDGGGVLVLFQFSGRGKRSGLDVGQIWTKGATLFELRDGKVVKIVQYLNRQRALATVGLSE